MILYPGRTYFMPIVKALAVFVIANIVLYWIIFQPSIVLPTSDAAPADAVSADAVPAEPTIPPPTAVIPPANGADWYRENSAVTQRANLAQDMIYGTGIIAERFMGSVEITLPEGSETAGGGLIFHMTGRDSVNNAQMVRLADGGRYLLWGYFDGEGVFQGEGGTVIEAPVAPATLKLRVRQNDYDIILNDGLLAQNIPLRQHSGYVGYISYGGPVTFSALTLSLSS